MTNKIRGLILVAILLVPVTAWTFEYENGFSSFCYYKDCEKTIPSDIRGSFECEFRERSFSCEKKKEEFSPNLSSSNTINPCEDENGEWRTICGPKPEKSKRQLLIDKCDKYLEKIENANTLNAQTAYANTAQAYCTRALLEKE